MFPGRWNLAGTPMVYLAGGRALAILEVLVHTDSDLVPRQWLYRVDVPEHVSVEIISNAKLPADWDSVPHGVATQEFGTAWVREGQSCILRVPSVISREDYNFLINPTHREFSKLKISKAEPFAFDSRLHPKK